MKQQTGQEFILKPSERTKPTVRTTVSGEAIEFNASMAKDQRGYECLGIFIADLMHMVSTPAP
jgi:hypothetical protein